MAEQREVKQWITVNGRHVPIFEKSVSQGRKNQPTTAKQKQQSREDFVGARTEFAKRQTDKSLNSYMSAKKTYSDSANRRGIVSAKKKSIPEQNEDIKARQIAQAQAERDKLNGKKRDDDEIKFVSKRQATKWANSILENYGTKQGYNVADKTSVNSKDLFSALEKFYRDNGGSAVGHSITHKDGALFIDGKKIVQFAQKSGKGQKGISPLGEYYEDRILARQERYDY